MLAFLTANLATILAVVVALDTALAEIPAIKANSVFQLLSGILLKLAGK